MEMKLVTQQLRFSSNEKEHPRGLSGKSHTEVTNYVYPDGVGLQELELFTVGGCLPYLLALRNEALGMRETPAFT